MKVIYYFEKIRPDKNKAVIKSIYGDEITFISENPWRELERFEEGDFLICDSVEDLTDNLSAFDVDAIVKEYMNIYSRGIELMFDRSTQCNSLFIKTLINSEDDFEGVLRKCVMNYAGQRDIAMKYARKHMVTAISNGNRVGIKKGTKLTTKKSLEMKARIRELSKDFEGNMDDDKVLEELKIARNTYYKYKKELKGGN